MFHGSIVALVTPMTVAGDLDLEALERLVEFHVTQGTDAIVSVGTTGESATLDPGEHCLVMRQTVDFARGRLPVIGGTGANSTTEAIHLTRCALEGGVDACLLVTPYYNKPPQEGLYQHFRAVAEAVPIPQLLYNVPGRTACDLLPETVARLADIPNIVGIKEASSLDRCRELIECCGDRMDVLCGEDHIAREAVQAGGKGVISVTANVAPAAMHEMMAAALSGDSARAGAVDEQLSSLHQALFVEANPIPVKWAVSELGLMAAGIRLPLIPLDPRHHQQVRAAMRQAGIVDSDS